MGLLMRIYKIKIIVCKHNSYPMKNTLLEKLLVFYEEDPGDPFNLYALALEYQKHDAKKAASSFDELLKKFPTYLPTYYHAAQLFSNMDENEKANRTFHKGIELATEQGNVRTQQELVRALRTFEDEQMDE